MSAITPTRSFRAKASYERLTISIGLIHVGYVSMQYAMHETDAADGRLFECAEFAQRVHLLAGAHRDDESDEVVYVLSGSGSATVEGRVQELRPGIGLFV